MYFLFFNSIGRLRSGWRFAVSLFLFVFLLITLSGAFLQFHLLLGEIVSKNPAFYLYELLVSIAVLIVAGWLCGKLFEDLPFKTLGCAFRGYWWRDFLLGSLFGATTLAFTAVIAIICGGLELKLNSAASLSAILQTLAVTFVIFIFAAAYEEVMARSYPLQTLVRARLGWLGVILTSTFFAALHLANPNAAPYFTFINTLLAGVWFAVAYLKVRNLWLPLGLHWAWNWAMISVFGLPVSGLTEFGGFRPEPILRGFSNSNQAWLNGGDYGLEGGAACTIAISVAILLTWLAPFFKPDAELLALTSRENPKTPPETISIL